MVDTDIFELTLVLIHGGWEDSVYILVLRFRTMSLHPMKK